MSFVDFYQNYIFFIMWFIFIVLIALIFLNIKNITKQFREIKRKTWIYLLIIFLIGLSLRFFVFPHVHLMYMDEPLHLEAAKNMNLKHQPIICQYTDYDSEDCWMWFVKPPGWPFLISIAFLIFGLNNYYALYFSSLLGSLSIILIFLLGYLIFRNEKVGLWSSFFLALTPIYILWSNSAETNNASVFFVLLTMLFFIVYMKSEKRAILILAILSLIFTSLVRFENIILVAIFFLTYPKLSKSLSRSSFWRIFDLFYPIIVIIVLILANIGWFFLTEFIRTSIFLDIIDFYYLNFFHFLKTTSFNYIYLPFAALALFFRDKKDANGILYLIISFMFFFSLHLLIFSESRMALMPGIFIIILSAYSLEKFCNLFRKYSSFVRVFIILIFLLIFALNLDSTYENIPKQFNKYFVEADSLILETESVMQIVDSISENCYIVAAIPVVLTSISNMRSLDSETALRNPDFIDELIKKGECVYYFYDGYCTDWPISPLRGSKKRCVEMLEIFDYTKEKQFERGKTKYFLFRINGVSG